MKLLHYLPLILLLISLSTAKKSRKNKSKPKKKPIDEHEDFGIPSEPKIGPGGMPFNKTTSCETFGKFARFNPHSVVGITWFVFYYWANSQSSQLYKFKIPNKTDLKWLHTYLDGHLPKRFNWSNTLVLQKDLLTNATTLLEERGDRGEYLEYMILADIPKGNLTYFRSVRIRQTGDNKYLAIMSCKDHTAYIMSQLNAVPAQKDIQVEASRLGYIGRKGKSYLYQGHEWMPIPEQDENDFWHANRELKNIFKY